MTNQSTFDGIHMISHYVGDDGSYQSSDEDGVKGPTLHNTQQRSGGRIRLRPNLGDTDSEEEEDDEALRLSVPQSASHKSTTVWLSPTGSWDRGCQYSLRNRRCVSNSHFRVDVWIWSSEFQKGNSSSFHITLMDLVYFVHLPFVVFVFFLRTANNRLSEHHWQKSTISVDLSREWKKRGAYQSLLGHNGAGAKGVDLLLVQHREETVQLNLLCYITHFIQWFYIFKVFYKWTSKMYWCRYY